MPNPYLRHLSKIEFVVTNACTGRCKHCFEGEHSCQGPHIDPQIAADAVCKIASCYDIKTVMAFGGEPLLYPQSVYAIMKAARDAGVPNRQVITNGYFSKNMRQIEQVAGQLAECGVNDLLLSVDAFHQETIAIEDVQKFASSAIKYAIPVRLSPAWLVSAENDNPYNRKTRAILDAFAPLNLPVSEGNVVYKEGNALKYLAEYFEDDLPENPYIEDPYNLKCVSFSSNGDVLGGNVYSQDILDLLSKYEP